MAAKSAGRTDEVALIKESLRVLISAFEKIERDIRPGATEAQLASKMGRCIRALGAESTAFRTIIACGRSSAKPHARPSKTRKLKNGRHVVVDAGAARGGYNSDLTRTYFIGRISPRLKKIYNIAKEAQRLAIQKIRPEVRASYIDNIAREYIKKKGFGRYFVHGLGHGIGRKVHQPPKISAKSKDVLKAGMVITIEPGIYIPRIGGVRIEDMVLVTKKGCKILSEKLAR